MPSINESVIKDDKEEIDDIIRTQSLIGTNFAMESMLDSDDEFSSIMPQKKLSQIEETKSSPGKKKKVTMFDQIEQINSKADSH
jgi:hypothetical protein